MSLTVWLDEVLSTRARLAVLGAGFLLLVAVFFPLWEITMFAQMFPEGIRMWIYPHKLVGGNAGADLQGINILNHYIGMQEIRAQDFPEMKFIPFALGLFFLLGLRTAVFGRQHIANFDVYSYPGPGTYLLVAYALALGVLLVVEARRKRLTVVSPKRVAAA